MLSRFSISTLLLQSLVAAYPWVVDHASVDPRRLPDRHLLKTRQAGSAATCPNNPNHTGAAPYTAKYPYCGAKNGLPGHTKCVGNIVPAPGDTAHAFVPPGPLDIRGPCPGLNVAANHNFLSHDGITNFTELIDAQQNVYGVAYDLAVVLAVLGVSGDGDPIGTTKLSIGCDATSRTSSTGFSEPGLDGHLKFEGDASLTRNDYLLDNGDNFSFNSTLYQDMSNVAKTISNGIFDRKALAQYRKQRFDQSVHENGGFYFDPKSLLLYGAATFLYELMPSGGPAGVADQTTMDYFFVKEQLPPNWYSRTQKFTLLGVVTELALMYQVLPVPFGANGGVPDSFVGIGETGVTSSNSTLNATPAGISCALYQLITENYPAEFGGSNAGEYLDWVTAQINPLFGSLFGLGGALSSLTCPLVGA